VDGEFLIFGYVRCERWLDLMVAPVLFLRIVQCTHQRRYWVISGQTIAGQNRSLSAVTPIADIRRCIGPTGRLRAPISALPALPERERAEHDARPMLHYAATREDAMADFKAALISFPAIS
jgi:hypothetical protein